MYLPASINNFVLLETLFYSTLFPKESIVYTKDAICETSHNLIDIFCMNTTTTTDHLIKLLYEECGTPVLLTTLGKQIPEPERETKLSTKVLLINSLEQVDTFMEVIYEFRLGKDQRKYFVIIEWYRDSNQDQWLYYLFAKFWRKQILNVVVIFHKHSVQVYTYQLLADSGSLSANISEPTAMQEQEFNLNVMNITSYPISKMFFNKLTNLQGRKLVVSMMPVKTRAHLKKDGRSYTGVDGHVADLIRSRMNATFVYIKPMTVYNNATNTGIHSNLVNGKAHFIFNALAYAPYNYNNTVEQTNAFDHVKFCVIVPRNGIKPIAFNIFHSMAPGMWILVVVSIIIVTIALTVVQHIQKNIANVPRKEVGYSAVEFALIILQSLLGDTIERIPFRLSIRFILLGWLIYSFLITNAFTATIISSLIEPNYRENINTIAELSASNLTILYVKSIEKNLKNGFDDESWKLIGDNFKGIDSWEQFLEIMHTNKTQYAYVIADYYCHYMVNTNIDTNTGSSIYHLVPECLASHPKVYLVQSGSMYLGYINELLGRFHEFGMFRRWIGETKFFSLMQGFKIENEEAKPINYASVQVVIGMEYLQTPFYMLGIGLLISTIIFCIEKVWRKMNKKRHQCERRTFVEEIELK